MQRNFPRNLIAVGLTFVVLSIGMLLVTDNNPSGLYGLLTGGVLVALVGVVLLVTRRGET